MIINLIDQYLRTKQQGGDGNVYRCSSAGDCARKLAYKRFTDTFIPEPIQPRGLLTMWYGGVVENLLMDILAENISDRQKELNITAGGVELTGHIDGIIHWEGVPFIVDIKSITSYGFSEAKAGEIDYKYRCQAECYMRGLNIPRFKFVYFDRQTADICEVLYEPNPTTWAEIEARFKAVSEATKDNLPAREYEPVTDKKGNISLYWVCSYCPNVKDCYPDFERIIEKGKVKYRPKCDSINTETNQKGVKNG